MRAPVRALAVGLMIAGTPAVARARGDDCPPGSVFRSEDGYSFCEPTVCENDAQCDPTSEVCRPIGLCMQVGELDPKRSAPAALTDAGQRLVVTQRCAPDRTCPQTTVCSEMGRCVSKIAAEKMGILTASSAAPAASGPDRSGKDDSAKKTCGCRAVGSSAAQGGEALAAGLALAAVVARRRSRRA